MAREQTANDKRERILEGAIEAFAAKGFHRTRVSDVAKAAGVADGTIYLYFENKNDLLAQVFAITLDRFWERGEEYLVAEGDPAAQLARLVETHLHFLGENRNMATVFQVDLRHSLSFLGDVSRMTLRRYLEWISQVIAKGQEQGIFTKELEPEEAARMVFGVLDQLVTSWVLTRRNYRLEQLTPKAQAFISRALAVDSGGAGPSTNGG